MFEHFPRESVEKIFVEIKAEIGDYQSLASNIYRQIREYYNGLLIFDGKKPKLVIGLSGGVDSTVASYLATRAIGREYIVTVNIPVREGDEDTERANLMGILGTRHYTIPIGSIVESEIDNINRFEEFSIDRNSEEEMDRIRIGNYASRLRVAILYDIARKLHGKVLGTGNRTEFVQGYAAKWGTPISFDFGILDDLYKVDIYELARILNVPKDIINAKPSTGYFPGQTHENELGATMEEQDVGAFLLFDKGMDIDEIVKRFGASREFLNSMVGRYKLSEHKRILRQPHVKVRFD